jgi:hypothetical protein
VPTARQLVALLEEAHALEAALLESLSAQHATAPSGEFRDLLEREVDAAREQEQAVRLRLEDLGAGRGPVRAASAVARRALAVARLSLDLARGTADAEHQLRGARGTCAPAALAAAIYSALEAAAGELGAARTAALARGHRAEKERLLAALRALVPVLAQDVLAADGEGTPAPETAGGTTEAAARVQAAAREAAAAVRAAGARDAGR